MYNVQATGARLHLGRREGVLEIGNIRRRPEPTGVLRTGLLTVEFASPLGTGCFRVHNQRAVSQPLAARTTIRALTVTSLRVFFVNVGNAASQPVRPTSTFANPGAGSDFKIAGLHRVEM